MKHRFAKFFTGRIKFLAATLPVLLLPAWWKLYSISSIGRDIGWFALVAASILVGLVTIRRTGLAAHDPAKSTRPADCTPITGLVLLAMLLALATIAHNPRFFFLRWTISLSSLKSFLTSGIAAVAAMTFIFTIVFAGNHPRRWLSPFMIAALLLAQIACGAMLLHTTGGTAVYSDDHPSFLFRIAEFWRSFPWFENYVPQWNAGVVNNVLVSSGTPAHAWLAAPLWWLLPPHMAHTPALIWIQIILIPWITVWALRSTGLRREGALAGGILALAASRTYFVWMLHFGTVGAAISWAMTPAAFAFLYAVLTRPSPPLSTLTGLILTGFLMAQWTPTMLIVPVWCILVALALRRRRPLHKNWPLALAAVLLAILLAHNLIAILGGRELLAYTLETDPADRLPLPAILARAWQEFVRTSGAAIPEMNPLVSAFGLAGLWFLPQRRLRYWTVLTLLGYIALFVLGPVLAPRLQMERLVIVAACLAVVPAACQLGRLFSRQGTPIAGLQAFTLSLLLYSLVSTTGIYAAQGFAPFTGMRPSITTLSDWVKQNVPENCRLLFAGPAVHAYGRGHIAYLPILTGREMMACDYYGFPPGMVEMDYPPRIQRTRPGGLHGFMTLHGVSYVITYQRRYIDFFRSQPEQFREAAFIESEEQHDFTVFEVLNSGSIFHQGKGTIKADFNRLSVTFLETPPAQAVIAYNWNPRLQAAPPAALFPFHTANGAIFTGICPNGESHVKIRYRNRF